MSGLTDTNIVLGQGNSIKEVHNIRRQDLDLNQQFVAQKTEGKKKEDKSKVQDFETGNRIELKNDEENKREEDPGYNESGSKKAKPNQTPDSQENNLIDIKV
ncbi:MAG: hypothetical protein K8R45_01920 [Desulfobacterales bacterium]|nr:hypothetical protein [Desulfobacterales bacterium]